MSRSRMKNTDHEWEKFGATEPYFGVLTHDQFRRRNLTDQSRAEFFATGLTYIDDVLKTIRSHIDPTYSPRRVK